MKNVTTLIQINLYDYNYNFDGLHFKKAELAFDGLKVARHQGGRLKFIVAETYTEAENVLFDRSSSYRLEQTYRDI